MSLLPADARLASNIGTGGKDQVGLQALSIDFDSSTGVQGSRSCRVRGGAGKVLGIRGRSVCSASPTRFIARPRPGARLFGRRHKRRSRRIERVFGFGTVHSNCQKSDARSGGAARELLRFSSTANGTKGRCRITISRICWQITQRNEGDDNDKSMVDPNHGRHSCAEPERCVGFDDRQFENLEREAGCGSCRGLPSQLQLSFGPSLLYDCEWRLWLLPFGHTVLRAGENPVSNIARPYRAFGKRSLIAV